MFPLNYSRALKSEQISGCQRLGASGEKGYGMISKRQQEGDLCNGMILHILIVELHESTNETKWHQIKHAPCTNANFSVLTFY